jgi:membrane peptidoglycan carboxypeptidase
MLLACVAAVILLGCCCGAWFFLYTGDLPDLAGLRRYAPQQMSSVSDPCLGQDVVAIPYDEIGYNLRAALNAAEGYERPGYANLRVQISRMMFCEPSRMLERHLNEWRTAVQLRWRFSRDELLTIYANRVGFGEDCTGIQAAAERYFRKSPDQLGISEAALLAGLIQRPSYLSPYKHPDRALQRRNQVIDAMVRNHAISSEQGETAKATSLGVTTK